LETEQTRVEQAIADAARDARVKERLGSMKSAEARVQDHWTVEERRAALGALSGVKWRPHGDSNPGYRRERAMS